MAIEQKGDGHCKQCGAVVVKIEGAQMTRGRMAEYRHLRNPTQGRCPWYGRPLYADETTQ